MRLLITGAQGMMGRDLRDLAETAGHEVWPTDVERLARDPEDRLDVTDFEGFGRAVDGFRPDAILHLAAMTHVDNCELDPERAYAVNTVGTQNVALHCRSRELPLVYISTGSVFDGTKPGSRSCRRAKSDATSSPSTTSCGPAGCSAEVRRTRSSWPR